MTRPATHGPMANLLALALVLAFGLVACAGGAPATSDTVASPSEAAPAADDAPASVPPASVPPASVPPNDDDDEAGDAPSEQLASGDACVLTPQEVSAAIGVEATEAVPDGTDEQATVCTYSSADGTPVFLATLTTDVTQDLWLAYLASEDENVEPVSGVGDEAVWYGEAVLLFHKGDKTLGLWPLTADPSTMRDPLIELGRIAAGRL